MSSTPSKYRENCVFLLLEEMSLHGHGQFSKYTIVDLPYSVRYACSLLSMAKQINKQNKKAHVALFFILQEYAALFHSSQMT